MMEVCKVIEDEGFSIISSDVEEGHISLVYRCVRKKDAVPVRLKVLKLSFPLPRHLSTYQHEQKIAESLQHIPGVLRTYERISKTNFEALVLEDFGGLSLDKWLVLEGPF